MSTNRNPVPPDAVTPPALGGDVQGGRFSWSFDHEELLTSAGWASPLSIGVDPAMNFLIKRRSYVVNAAAICMILFGMGFGIANLIQGRWSAAGWNVAISFAGLASLFCASISLHRVAFLVATLGGGALFFLSSLAVLSGAENYLLLNLVAVVFLADSPNMRWILASANAVAFLTVKMVNLVHVTDVVVDPIRYAVNVFLFLAGTCLMVELFRRLGSRYEKAIEARNFTLQKAQQELDAEHAALLARTEELRLANEAKEKLFSVVAHDLRGPVASLRGFLEALERGDIDAADFQGVHVELQEDVQRVSSCLENLLTWSAAQWQGIQPQPRSLRVAEAAAEAMALLEPAADSKRIRWKNQVPESAVVNADPQQLQAVFRNLLSNALKFTPADGRVTVGAFPKGECWEIAVEDTGVGVSSEQAAELFRPDRFYSTYGTDREKGLGLGLTICKEFVEANGGTIRADALPTGGMRFAFTLPAAR